MSYQALYRAWRPDTFSEMVGQDAIVRTLKHQVVSGRIAHAYLFCGTRGTGKTTAAKVLSRAINCLNPKGGDPCGECTVCRMLKEETSMDVVEIDAASNNGVDEIRDLRDKIKFPPSVTRYKVYIIDEVHMLSTGAFNALLKTLEEPPSHAVFILATTEPHKLPATILSRCQRFDFHRISVENLIERLMIVLGGIDRSASDDALQEIARAAEGAMRDALSLLDVCLSYTDGEVSGQLARDVLGTAGRAFMFDFADALINCNAGDALRQIDEMMRRGCDPTVFLRDTAAHLRCILLTGAMGAQAADVLEITQEDAQRFAEQAAQVSRERLTGMMSIFLKAEPDMKWASRPRTMLELAAVRACHPEQEADSALTERVERVEKLIEQGVPAAAAPKPVKAEKPAEAPAEKPKAPHAAPQPEEAPPEAYLAAVEKIRQIPSLKAVVAEMHYRGFADGIVRIEFPKAKVMLMRVMERKQKEINALFTEVYGEPVAVNLSLEGGGAKPEKQVSDIARKTITQSYDIFGRDKIEIVD